MIYKAIEPEKVTKRRSFDQVPRKTEDTIGVLLNRSQVVGTLFLKPFT